MLLEFSSLNVAASASAAHKTRVSQSDRVSSRNGLRIGGLQARTWRELKKEVSGRARVCAVADLFESELLGIPEEGAAEEAPAKTTKPKTGKAALLLKSDRVSPAIDGLGLRWGVCEYGVLSMAGFGFGRQGLRDIWRFSS
jgi:hypothetical protein